MLFSGSDDCSIKKWTNENGQWLNTRTATGVYLGKGSETIAVSALVALGSHIVVSGSARGSIKVRWESSRVRHIFRTHSSSAVSFFPVSQVWDAETCQCLEEHVLHEGGISGFAVYGNTLVSSSSDRTAKVWEVHTDVVRNDLELSKRAEEVAKAISTAMAGSVNPLGTFVLGPEAAERTFEIHSPRASGDGDAVLPVAPAATSTPMSSSEPNSVSVPVTVLKLEELAAPLRSALTAEETVI